MNFKKGYSDVNGISMYYEIHGEGDPLVLIHGGGSTITTTFGEIIPMFAEDFRIIAVELQAHGHTSDRDAPESFEQDADDVATLLNNLHISKASFFGFSNGGTTAMQIAHRYPHIVNKLIIASALYKREGMIPGFFDGMQYVTIDNMPEILREEFLKVNPDNGKLLNMFNKDKERVLHFRDWKDGILQSIKAPSLIICGDKDVVLAEHAIAISKLISDSRLMILPGDHGSYIGTMESCNKDRSMVALVAHV
ncbi:MAG: alpha/beta hydrolase, partial [Bacteroidetes bacterium]|nr:alpha/beta hydrolase [Bacteroidota bacterium]